MKQALTLDTLPGTIALLHHAEHIDANSLLRVNRAGRPFVIKGGTE
jgi:hypothetical protein